MISDQKLHNLPQTEASTCFLLSGRFARLQKHQQRSDEVASQALLFAWLEELWEHVGQDLNHADGATIVYDFFVLADYTVGEHMLGEEGQDTFVGFGPLARFVQGINKVLLEMFGKLTEHASVESDSHSLRVALQERLVSEGTHKHSESLAVVPVGRDHIVALVDSLLLRSGLVDTSQSQIEFNSHLVDGLTHGGDILHALASFAVLFLEEMVRVRLQPLSETLSHELT